MPLWPQVVYNTTKICNKSLKVTVLRFVVVGSQDDSLGASTAEVDTNYN